MALKALAVPAAMAFAQGASSQIAGSGRASQGTTQLRQLARQEIDEQTQLAEATEEAAGFSAARRFAFGGGGGQASLEAQEIAGDFGADLFALRTRFRDQAEATREATTTSPLEIGLSAASGFLSTLPTKKA